MKTTKLFLSLVLSTVLFLTASAQNSNKKVLKVSYTTNNVSDFIVTMLKNQIKNPTEYSKVINQISKIKIYHTLYQNLNTNESIYVLDSIKDTEGIKTVGHIFYTIKNTKKEVLGKETFMGSEFNFKGNSETIKWTITNELKEFNGYKCRKAISENDPEIYVWFTTDIAIDAGPYIYYGLPGLVLESNSFFQSVNATKVMYTNEDIFENKLKEVKENMVAMNEISLTEVIVKKGNFKRMAEKGKK